MSTTRPHRLRQAQLDLTRLGRALLGAAILALAPIGVTDAAGDASHAGWPKINGKLIINKQNLNETMRGDRSQKRQPDQLRRRLKHIPRV